VSIISDDIWARAKRDLFNRYSNSSKIEICNNIIRDFEAANPKKKYKSDLDVFVKESRLEDFYNENGETIFVSTMHKAKGKEFDNVFILLDNFNSESDASKRQLYVAMTRAKQNLSIHLNGNYLNHLNAENLFYEKAIEKYLPPKMLALHLSYKDIWLDYFINKQYFISQLISGEYLSIKENELINAGGHSVLRFSKSFLSTIGQLKDKGYQLKEAKVNFIIYWKKEDTAQQVKIILPELWFEK
jgi:ATP-dependent DNA helicase RecQ